jgi:quinol monooxygenase YgiN
MAYVVAAKWRAHPGKADRLLEVIQEMTPPSRAEPGCIFYQAQRSEDDPNLFLLYEQYADQACYEAHMETEHFTRLVKAEAIPELLAAREREFYSTIGDQAGGLSS